MFLFLTSSHLNWSMVRISRSFWLCFLDLSNTCLILYSSFSATASFSFPLSLFINFPYLCTWQIQKFNCQNYFRPIYYEGFLKDNGLFVFHSLWITLLISNLLIKDFFSFWMICYTVFQFLLKALDYILQFLNENLCEDLISHTKLIFFTTKVETFIAFERFKKLPNVYFLTEPISPPVHPVCFWCLPWSSGSRWAGLRSRVWLPPGCCPPRPGSPDSLWPVVSGLFRSFAIETLKSVLGCLFVWTWLGSKHFVSLFSVIVLAYSLSNFDDVKSCKLLRNKILVFQKVRQSSNNIGSHFAKETVRIMKCTKVIENGFNINYLNCQPLCVSGGSKLSSTNGSFHVNLATFWKS